MAKTVDGTPTSNPIGRAVIQLRKLAACTESIVWVAKQESKAAAWDKCTRPEWMAWLLCKVMLNRISTGELVPDGLRLDLLKRLRNCPTDPRVQEVVTCCVIEAGQRQPSVPGLWLELYGADEACYLLCVTGNLFDHCLRIRCIRRNDIRVISDKALCNIFRKYFPTWPERQ